MPGPSSTQDSGGPGTIPATWVPGSSAGRGGTRPSIKACTAGRLVLAAVLEGRVPSRPLGFQATPLAEVELGPPLDLRAAWQNASPPELATPGNVEALLDAGFWRAGYHPGHLGSRQLRWPRWNSALHSALRWLFGSFLRYAVPKPAVIQGYGHSTGPTVFLESRACCV